ncbi:MAG: DUF1190 domain-containing protein [Geobacter sp.]|nr:DUF1190 domain-containing protein [Geobacter sp.]
MKRRSTLQITLVLVGAIATAGCGGKDQRPLYKSKQDCLDDWGGNEQDCQEPGQGTPHYRSGYYYGPIYRSGGRAVARSIGMATISRGGFGSSGHFHGFFGG